MDSFNIFNQFWEIPNVLTGMVDMWKLFEMIL